MLPLREKERWKEIGQGDCVGLRYFHMQLCSKDKDREAFKFRQWLLQTCLTRPSLGTLGFWGTQSLGLKEKFSPVAGEEHGELQHASNRVAKGNEKTNNQIISKANN
jgi:hypothetical protein